MRFDATLLLLLVLGFLSTPNEGSLTERLEFPAGGFSLELPDGWDGPVEAHEEALPAASSYRMRHAGAGELAEAEVRVIRRANLNPLQRQQWVRGRAAIGLGDLRPVEALRGDAMPFPTGVGYRAEGGGRTALVYFTAHGPTHYAIVASAPSDRFISATGSLLGIARSVRFHEPAR
jgi:hypothetical protein